MSTEAISNPCRAYYARWKYHSIILIVHYNTQLAKMKKSKKILDLTAVVFRSYKDTIHTIHIYPKAWITTRNYTNIKLALTQVHYTQYATIQRLLLIVYATRYHTRSSRLQKEQKTTINTTLLILYSSRSESLQYYNYRVQKYQLCPQI